VQWRLARSFRDALDVASDGSVIEPRVSFGLFIGDVERVDVY